MNTDEAQCAAQMPVYKSHKTVWALKIKEIRDEKPPIFKGAICRGCFALNSACGHCEQCDWEMKHGPRLGWFIVPEESGFAPIKVDGEYMAKHKPQPGGYYVVYSDGYKSFSPAKAFEEGYTRI
jgi:hypothetical protein